MTKKFGQNFLTDRGARERLAAAVQAAPGDLVWEIGPGVGAETALLLDSGAMVRAFEIDHGFARILTRVFGDTPGFSLVEGDFLKTWPDIASGRLAVEGKPEMPDRIFGNLPYNVAAVIVASLLEADMIPPRMVFTVQKEAAVRMAAKPGSKDYSAFSVLCTSACDVKLLFDLGAFSFWPRPRVTSTVVLMSPKSKPLGIADRRAFSRFVRSVFASRRKTLRNNLGVSDSAALDAVLADLGKPMDVRAEALDPAELHAVHLAISTARSLAAPATGSVECPP